MKLEQQIALSLIEVKELTVSEKVVKTFRSWLISKGGRCEPSGDVVTPKGGIVRFAPASKPKAYRVRLEVAL